MSGVFLVGRLESMIEGGR